MPAWSPSAARAPGGCIERVRRVSWSYVRSWSRSGTTGWPSSSGRPRRKGGSVPEPEVEATSGVIEREVRIAAPPETVFEFFVDPEKYVRWKGRMAWLDPRPGGEYRVAINDQAVAKGAFVEIDPPRRVVFTWGWEGTDAVPPGSSTVEVTLEPDGEGTILRL